MFVFVFVSFFFAIAMVQFYRHEMTRQINNKFQKSLLLLHSTWILICFESLEEISAQIELAQDELSRLKRLCKTLNSISPSRYK